MSNNYRRACTGGFFKDALTHPDTQKSRECLALSPLCASPHPHSPKFCARTGDDPPCCCMPCACTTSSSTPPRRRAATHAAPWTSLVRHHSRVAHWHPLAPPPARHTRTPAPPLLTNRPHAGMRNWRMSPAQVVAKCACACGVGGGVSACFAVRGSGGEAGPHRRDHARCRGGRA